VATSHAPIVYFLEVVEMRRSGVFMRVAGCAAVVMAGLAWATPALGQDRDLIGEAFDVSEFTLVHLDVPQELGPHALIPVVVDGHEATMTLFRHSMRSSDFEVVLSDGSRVDPPALHTYRGMLTGVRGSRVAASLHGGHLTALIRLGDVIWAIQPAVEADPNADADLHVVYRMDDVNQGDWSCGVVAGPEGQVLGGETLAGGGTKIAEIAFDCDYEFFTANGQNVANTVANTETLLNGVETIYLNDVDIGYEITTILVRDNPSDPYTSSVPDTLLGQFRAEWKTNQAGVPRDIAHLLTGRNLQGGIIGIAFLSGVCNFNLEYGLSETTFTGSFPFRVALTAHEVGHNWSAQHCDGQPDCAIMCSGLGGCPGGVGKFSVIAKAQITNFSNAIIGCLDFIPDAKATWKATVTTTSGDEEYQVGEIATMTLSLDMEPDVDGVTVLGLAATIFDVLGDAGASLGEIPSWSVLNDLAELTGDLTETDGTSLFNVNAGQLTAFGPFTPDDPIDVLEFNWGTDTEGPYPVSWNTSTESMVIWQKDNGEDVGVDWAVGEVEVGFDVVQGQACYADCTGDGNLDILDFVCFQAFWSESEPYADCNKDGEWNILDFVCFQGAFSAGCP
jgi:hypothetical protein